jgi:rare lipoprotein A
MRNLLNKSLILWLFMVVSCSAKIEYRPPDSTYRNVEYGKPYVIRGVTYYPMTRVDRFVQTGIASWYGTEEHGKPTASGEPFDMYAMTAAHKTLPLGSYVLVENLENKKKLIVRINDRGPFIRGRVIDLSYSAAKKIGIAESGLAKVRVTLLSENPNYYVAHGKRVDINKGSFAIQIGSFSNYLNASNLASNVDRGQIKGVEINGNRYYRVWITGFNDRRKAEKYLEKIMMTFPDAFVIAQE